MNSKSTNLSKYHFDSRSVISNENFCPLSKSSKVSRLEKSTFKKDSCSAKKDSTTVVPPTKNDNCKMKSAKSSANSSVSTKSTSNKSKKILVDKKSSSSKKQSASRSSKSKSTSKSKKKPTKKSSTDSSKKTEKSESKKVEKSSGSKKVEKSSGSKKVEKSSELKKSDLSKKQSSNSKTKKSAEKEKSTSNSKRKKSIEPVKKVLKSVDKFAKDFIMTSATMKQSVMTDVDSKSSTLSKRLKTFPKTSSSMSSKRKAKSMLLNDSKNKLISSENSGVKNFSQIKSKPVSKENRIGKCLKSTTQTTTPPVKSSLDGRKNIKKSIALLLQGKMSSLTVSTMSKGPTKSSACSSENSSSTSAALSAVNYSNAAVPNALSIPAAKIIEKIKKIETLPQANMVLDEKTINAFGYYIEREKVSFNEYSYVAKARKVTKAKGKSKSKSSKGDQKLMVKVTNLTECTPRFRKNLTINSVRILRYISTFDKKPLSPLFINIFDIFQVSICTK